MLGGALLVALIVAVVASAASGQLAIPAREVLGSLLHAAGIDALPLPQQPGAEETLWTIRFPRVVMSILVGAALAASGAVLQAVFGNPLAEPGVIGVSSGAAVGAAAAIVFGWSAAGPWTVAAAAFVTGVASVLVVYLTARRAGRTEVVTLLLTGVAVTAVTGAGLALLTFLGDQQAREQIVFWQLGSLNGSRWSDIAVVLPVTVAGVAVSVLLGRRLDLLALGERSARHLGVRVEALRAVSVVTVALLVAVAVAFTGVIGFVGLVVPHLVRMVIGPAHRPLILDSAIGGALLLVVADLVARTAVPYADLPIGMLTALVGGPFFFWLLRRTRNRAGGWS
nr:iron ABC transporter permease [Herbiconiux sp. L3-i23]